MPTAAGFKRAVVARLLAPGSGAADAQADSRTGSPRRRLGPCDPFRVSAFASFMAAPFRCAAVRPTALCAALGGKIIPFRGAANRRARAAVSRHLAQPLSQRTSLRDHGGTARSSHVPPRPLRSCRRPSGLVRVTGPARNGGTSRASPRRFGLSRAVLADQTISEVMRRIRANADAYAPSGEDACGYIA